MPAAKRNKPILPPAEEAEMLAPSSNSQIHDGAQSAPRDIPTYDARIFDRFVKAVRELENAMDGLADAGFVPAVSTVATPIYSEQSRKQIHTRYSINYQLYKEHARPDRD